MVYVTLRFGTEAFQLSRAAGDCLHFVGRERRIDRRGVLERPGQFPATAVQQQKRSEDECSMDPHLLYSKCVRRPTSDRNVKLRAGLNE